LGQNGFGKINRERKKKWWETSRGWWCKGIVRKRGSTMRRPLLP
jgi:hypothetical protein